MRASFIATVETCGCGAGSVRLSSQPSKTCGCGGGKRTSFIAAVETDSLRGIADPLLIMLDFGGDDSRHARGG
jgi:hypothetical protein